MQASSRSNIIHMNLSFLSMSVREFAVVNLQARDCKSHWLAKRSVIGKVTCTPSFSPASSRTFDLVLQGSFHHLR